ncbi:hypothetical protein GIB67_035431 [Kingdonia uniflora]|uniref:Uncharacterized protein n=1 Tax=Kingdonia uniflora TaxID=39325 RepID=A0A7J7P0A8_9MAGN|nr:hypothetical protein GIB67_035431 [Kingdonia uniflora]
MSRQTQCLRRPSKGNLAQLVRTKHKLVRTTLMIKGSCLRKHTCRSNDFFGLKLQNAKSDNSFERAPFSFERLRPILSSTLTARTEPARVSK